MNTTSVNCFRDIWQIPLLTQEQLTTLVVINLTLMVANVIANALVIYILVSTKQLKKITCKVIFILSVSDLMIGLFGQNLCTTLFFENTCFVRILVLFTMVCLVHLSMYSIAIIGIDRYLRIKRRVSFKKIWTAKVVSTLLSISCFLALFQGLMTTMGLLLKKLEIGVPIYVGIDILILGVIIFLQILTIRSSNNLFNESEIASSKKINKRVTKLSMRIMLSLCFFMTPHLVTSIFYKAIINQLTNDHRQSVFEFITLLFVMFVPVNSLANAVLFSITNVKAKQFLKKIGK